MAAERDALLLDIYTEQGDVQEQQAIALRKFRRSRCKSAFATLLEVVGQDKRESALAQEVAVIHEQEGLSLNDAAFLVEMEKPTSICSNELSSSMATVMNGCHRWQKRWNPPATP